MSSEAGTDSAATREEAPSPEVVPKQDEEPPIPPIRPRTVNFADQQHPGHNRSNPAQKQPDNNESGNDQSSESASLEDAYEPSDSGGSERTASLYDNSSTSDDSTHMNRYSNTTDSSDSDVGRTRSDSPRRRRTARQPRPSAGRPYDHTEDHHTIHPGLKTAMGSHRGSMLKAVNRSKAVRRQATKLAAGSPGGGLITIKKLLTRTTIANAMKKSRRFEADYDEIFLETCEDKDALEKLVPLIDSAINLERSREPFEKEPCCAIIFLDNCTEAFKVLDELFELKKSNWGTGDDGFIRWATGHEQAALGNHSFRHSISRAGRSLLERTLPNTTGSINVHLSERIPESFSWEPFGFEHQLYLTKDKSKKADDGSNIHKSNVKRLMFTFEFLVPYTCRKKGCKEPRKLLQCGTFIHFHMFVQRRSVLAQSAVDANKSYHFAPSQDNLCIIADIPVTNDGASSSLSSTSVSPGQSTQATGVPITNDELRKLFYRSVAPSKYRFRPAFSLNSSSENWYTPALIYFILKEIIECWAPVVQACIEHVEYREKSVLQDVTLANHTRSLWEDKQHWIYLRTTLDAHVGNFSRLRTYISETFHAESKFMKEMSEDLSSRFTEVEKKIEKQLQERTNNLVDLVFSSINSQDAHISAETGTSMWRLSWITFVFLPLTFLAGVFGMNVETFANPENVYIKWYFVSAILMLMFVIAVIWVLKKRMGWNAILSSARSIENTLKRVLEKIRKTRTRDDADLEANTYLLSDVDSESDEKKEVAAAEKPDDKTLENEKKNEAPSQLQVGVDGKEKTTNGAPVNPLESILTEKEPGAPENSQKATSEDVVGKSESKAEQPKVEEGSTELADSSAQEQQASDKGESANKNDDDKLSKDKKVMRKASMDDIAGQSETESDSSSTKKKRFRNVTLTRKPKRRNALIGGVRQEDPDDVEDVRIKGSYQASAGDHVSRKNPKKIRSILSTKSMFGGENDRNLRRRAVELDSTPISQSSKFQPGDLELELSFTPPPKDVKVRIVMLFGYAGYNAIISCEDSASSAFIEVNSIKQFCNLESGNVYSDAVRYGTPYTHGHVYGRVDPFQVNWPPQMTERDFLQPKKAQMQAFYGVMLYFLSFIRTALEAIYRIESTENKMAFSPRIEISFIASQLMCASEHTRDLITEFNEENPFNAKIIALTPTHVAVDGMTMKFMKDSSTQSRNLPTLQLDTKSKRPRYALLRRQEYLWVYDLNTAKSLDERDEEPEESYSCPGEEGQWFSPSGLHSAIEDYLGILTQGSVSWYDREDTVCMDILRVLEHASIFTRHLRLPRHVKPWQDSLMEEFDWLLAEKNEPNSPRSREIPKGPGGKDTEICDEPGIRFYPVTDTEFAPFYTDVGFLTTEKVLKMTVNTLTKTIRKVADGSYVKQPDKEKNKSSNIQVKQDELDSSPYGEQSKSPEKISELPLVVLVGNIGDDTTEHPLPPNLWHRVKSNLEGVVDLQIYRGRDVVASVMGMDLIQNAQRKMTFDITTGRLWEYPNDVTVDEKAE